jgi:hypothetical protein
MNNIISQVPGDFRGKKSWATGTKQTLRVINPADCKKFHVTSKTNFRKKRKIGLKRFLIKPWIHALISLLSSLSEKAGRKAGS